MFSEDEEEEEEEEETQQGYSYSDPTEKVRDHAAETLLFQHNKKPHSYYSEEFISPRESLNEESEENHSSETILLKVYEFESKEAEEEYAGRNADPVTNSVPLESKPTSAITMNTYKCDKNCDGISHHS